MDEREQQRKVRHRLAIIHRRVATPAAGRCRRPCHGISPPRTNPFAWATRFGEAGVSLHSFSERIELSSAAGRMQYNVLGAFAQFFREQLAENVRMGMAEAMAQGRWLNRPPTGYDLSDGMLVPNERAPTVRRIFTLRAEGQSQARISELTGVNHSTVLAILRNRAYLGKIKHLDEWLPGIHEPLVSEELWNASRRGRVADRRRGRDLLSGRVVCGLCGRRMSIESNGQGQSHYRCKHRGQGCKQPARSNVGLLRAAVLGMHLVADDPVLQETIRKRLRSLRGEPGHGRHRKDSAAPASLERLYSARRKLLQLHYDDLISKEQFGEEQARLTVQIEDLKSQVDQSIERQAQADELLRRFEEVTELLAGIDVAKFWQAASESERRTLADELIEDVSVHPDHLEVSIAGSPRMNVLLSEVGLKHSENVGVGGGT